MRKIIITDLTRFSNKEILCTAGIDVDTNECIRPVPYLQTKRCRELKMLPGAILTGDFSIHNNTEMPHSEDMAYQNLTFHGHCSSDEFRTILSKSAYQSIEDGFAVSLNNHQKHIPREASPARSLITISVNPHSVQIVQDRYKPSKIKAHITDNAGKEFSFLAITDFGLHEYSEQHYQKAGNYSKINNLIQSQEKVFLRIGLSRFYQAPNGKSGYWMQVNGIYSFPEYFKAARRYE